MPPVLQAPVSQRPKFISLDQLPQCLQRLTLHPPPPVAVAVAAVAAVAAEEVAVAAGNARLYG